MDELEQVARELQRRGIGGSWYWEVGETIYVRAVTFHYVGKVASVASDYIVLDPAAWVADSGRFGAALSDGFSSSAEVEPIIGPLVVQRAAIVDSMAWKHAVPTGAQ